MEDLILILAIIAAIYFMSEIDDDSENDTIL